MREWVRELGAHHVIDHTAPMPEQLRGIGLDAVDYVASLTHTDKHLVEIAAMLGPQGKLGLIDDPASLDVPILKPKSISLHWELMYTRSMYQTPDMVEQHNILVRVAELVDAGALRTTLAAISAPSTRPICAAPMPCSRAARRAADRAVRLLRF